MIIATTLVALGVALAAGASPAVLLIPVAVLGWCGLGLAVRRSMMNRGFSEGDADEAATWWIVFGPLGLLLWRPRPDRDQ